MASVDESLIDEGLELSGHLRATAAHFLDHEDGHEILFAVDEEVRARGAGPPEHPRGGEVAGSRRVDDDAHTEPVTFAARGAAARSGVPKSEARAKLYLADLGWEHTVSTTTWETNLERYYDELAAP